MLVLTRKASQKIVIGEDISITIVRIDGNRVRIGIDAPQDVTIQREELLNGEQFQGNIEHELVTC